ncbi:hypothetical protein EVAR_74780_1 [Eumeta japonica]|uniref:Uncharacterized protein n=1 Tax=Eumeta variegata TaxID=151549 RepID=A0A4C1SRZ2_EUMVA|nr:hypothetical protein EVAR_74780_1 [Eumeta japonica]
MGIGTSLPRVRNRADGGRGPRGPGVAVFSQRARWRRPSGNTNVFYDKNVIATSDHITGTNVTDCLWRSPGPPPPASSAAAAVLVTEAGVDGAPVQGRPLATPCSLSTSGVSPAWLLLGRPLRCRLNSLRDSATSAKCLSHKCKKNAATLTASSNVFEQQITQREQYFLILF